MGRWALIAGLVVMAAIGLLRMLPWATQDRTIVAGSPSLGGLTAMNPIGVGRGQEACVAPVPLTTETARVQVLVSASERAAPLKVTVTAPGYAAAMRIPATYAVGTYIPVSGKLSRPPPHDTVGRVCIRNAGHRPIALAGTFEPRSQVAAETKVGRKVAPDMALQFYTDKPQSYISRLGTTIDRAAALTGFVPAIIAWLVLAGLLATPVIALVLLAHRGRDAAGNSPPDEQRAT